MKYRYFGGHTYCFGGWYYNHTDASGHAVIKRAEGYLARVISRKLRGDYRYTGRGPTGFEYLPTHQTVWDVYLHRPQEETK